MDRAPARTRPANESVMRCTGNLIPRLGRGCQPCPISERICILLRLIIKLPVIAEVGSNCWNRDGAKRQHQRPDSIPQASVFEQNPSARIEQIKFILKRIETMRFVRLREEATYPSQLRTAPRVLLMDAAAATCQERPCDTR